MRKVITKAVLTVFVSSNVFSCTIPVKLTTVSLSLFLWTDSQTWSRDYVRITYVFCTPSSIPILPSHQTSPCRLEPNQKRPPTLPPHKDHRFVSVIVTSRKKRHPLVSQHKTSEIPCSYSRKRIGFGLLWSFMFFATRCRVILFLQHWFQTTRQAK